MGKRRKHVSNKEDFLMISKPSSSNSSKIFEQIPLDLIIQILTKLPAKSIAKFLCVSKQWNSILRSPNFTNMFLEVSSSCPRVLFSVRTNGKWLFYSTSQALNPDNNNYTSTLTTDYYMCSSLTPCSPYLFDHVNGLLCIQQGYEPKVTIFNPSTGQSIPLAIMRGMKDVDFHLIGYDSINKQYKVLCLSMKCRDVIKHHVLTLGIQKPAWRMIECSVPQHFPYSPICVNGVLYYLINNHRETLVCFDVSSEKFRFIETNIMRSSKLENYKGKLGVFSPYSFFDRNSRILELLVLEGVEKNEWSQHIYVLPLLWKDLVEDMSLYIVGMTCNGELVFSNYEHDPFYIFFYNMEKNTIARVRIQGLEFTRPHVIQIFLDHVENVKLI